MQTLAGPAAGPCAQGCAGDNRDRMTIDVPATAYEAQLCCDQDGEVVIT